MKVDPKKALQDALAGELRRARFDAGLTQADLALRLGISRTSVVNIEAAVQAASVFLMVEWSRLCGLSETTALQRACR